jgi:hypothetical protein
MTEDSWEQGTEEREQWSNEQEDTELHNLNPPP